MDVWVGVIRMGVVRTFILALVVWRLLKQSIYIHYRKTNNNISLLWSINNSA